MLNGVFVVNDEFEPVSGAEGMVAMMRHFRSQQKRILLMANLNASRYDTIRHWLAKTFGLQFRWDYDILFLKQSQQRHLLSPAWIEFTYKTLIQHNFNIECIFDPDIANSYAWHRICDKIPLVHEVQQNSKLEITECHL